jgi:GNAT superfamily N-acetyltransferase
MDAPEFIVADLRSHRDELVELNVEYVSWVFEEIDKYFGVNFEKVIGLPASQYVQTVIVKVCGAPPPRGRFYLVRVAGKLAGMGGLRGLSPDLAEIKRIYIRSEFRGLRLGEQVLGRLMSDARTFGFKHACLDTAPFMRAAHHLYEVHGFADRGPYEGVEVPPEFHAHWRFMERELHVSVQT